MKLDKKLSIIIPVYNVEEYLEETLQSIFNENMDGVEIIIIDDGSNDGTLDIVKKYPDIIVIKQKNSGPGKARNKGIEIATGKYITFIDGDDKVVNDSLKIRYELAEKYNADIVICETDMFSKNKEWSLKRHFNKSGIKNIENDEGLLWSLGPCNKIYKREVVRNIRFLESIKYGEDQAFVLNCYLKSDVIYYIDKVGYLYRQREGENNSLTQQIYANPAKTIKEITSLWEYSSNLFRNNNVEFKERLEGNFFYRLINVNIWGAFRYSIVNNIDVSNVLINTEKLISKTNPKYLERLGIIKKNIFKIFINEKDIDKKYIKIKIIRFLIFINDLILKIKK